AGEEDEHAADDDLEGGPRQRRVHVAVPHPGDRHQLDQHHAGGDGGGPPDVRGQGGGRGAQAPPRGAMPRHPGPHPPAGRRRPVRLPSSDRASAKPMLMPAPTAAATPTRKVFHGSLVAKAAAKSGASVETEPSISPASPGCTTWSTNSRCRAACSSSVGS